MERFESRLTAAELTFQEERHVKRVEGVLTVAGNPGVVATGEGERFSEALDQMLDRLERILSKRRTRRRDRRAPRVKDLKSQDSI